MKKNFTVIAYAFSICFLLVSFTYAQSLTIEEINRNPATYENEVVRVNGLVRQHVEGGTASTRFYILVGDAGGFIRVLTPRGLPETYKKYNVTGILHKDANQGSYFISEQSRTLAETAESPQPAVTPVPVTGTEARTFPLNIVLIVAGALILIVLLFLIVKRKKGGNEEETNDFETPVDESKPQDLPGQPSEDDFKTIRVLSGAPKTLVFIPGEFKIVSGADSGKSVRVAAYPSPSGNIVTIGREKVSGEREYAHIQLKEKTVSRKQAELIQKDGKISVRNLSETNFTQVDGVELKPGETAELFPNSTLRTGEVEFQYVT